MSRNKRPLAKTNVSEAIASALANAARAAGKIAHTEEMQRTVPEYWINYADEWITGYDEAAASRYSHTCPVTQQPCPHPQLCWNAAKARENDPLSSRCTKTMGYDINLSLAEALQNATPEQIADTIINILSDKDINELVRRLNIVPGKRYEGTGL